MFSNSSGLWLVFALYLIVFLLFTRFFWWHHLSLRDYWNKRIILDIRKIKKEAKRRNTELPFISILVPARNEALVIANTVLHLTKLEYPRDRMEIIVITDQKETLEKKNKNYDALTTQEVLEKLLAGEHPNWPEVKVVDVPYDFDGFVGGRCTGKEVKSTKGRALNYGLGFLNPKNEICAFYDAESRPEKKVLLYVAYRYLVSNKKEEVWYGPVFQVRNFYEQGPISKVASLYQCFSHKYYLPHLLKKLPFVGGTNFFITTRLLKKVGGYDSSTLTEDVEIGVRVYCETGYWPIYIPYWSTEQTPATYPAFFRQRLRWGSGHLQVTARYRNSKGIYPEYRRKKMVVNLWLKGEGEWLLFQGIFVAAILILLASIGSQINFNDFPLWVLVTLRLFALIYLGYTYYLYHEFSPYMDEPKEKIWQKKLITIIQFLFLPLITPFLLFPYSAAMILKALHREPKVWVKTPRTKELESKVAA